MNKEFARFTRKVVLLLPLLLFVIGVTSQRNPVSFLSSREHDDAARLVRGENIVFDEAENDRVLLKNYVGLVPESPDVLVIGSSRATYFHKGLFPGIKFFNASVLGRTLPDALALYELFRENGRLPKSLILEVDPYLIENRPSYAGFETRGFSLYAEYSQGLTRRGQAPPSWDYGLALAQTLPEQIKELSPATFQKAFVRMVGQLTRTETPVPNAWDMAHPPPNFILRLSDGALVYALPDTQLPPAELERRVLKSLQSGPSNRTGQAFSPTAKEQFEKFVRGIQQDGVKVYFVFVPFNSLYRNRLRGTPADQFVDDAEAYYRTFAREANIQVIGSFDADRAGCAADEFVDGLHPLLPCIVRIWQAARADVP